MLQILNALYKADTGLFTTHAYFDAEGDLWNHHWVLGDILEHFYCHQLACEFMSCLHHWYVLDAIWVISSHILFLRRPDTLLAQSMQVA